VLRAVARNLDQDAATLPDPLGGGRRRAEDEAVTAERLESATIDPYDACGHLPIRGRLALARRRGLDALRLDLRNSGDTAGDRGRVVGYGAWAFRRSDVASVAN
jgi:MEMO1 family protein